jgi:hypothetical protein
MWAAILLTYKLLRQIHVSRLAAAGGSSVLLFAPPAFDGWTRLTMAEPLGLVLLVAACLIALQHGRGERHVGWQFLTICLGIVFLKEMLVVTLLLPIMLIYAQGPDSSGIRRTRTRTLLVAVLASVPIAMLAVLTVAVRAPHDAYTGAFGSQIQPLQDAIAQWTLGIFPFDPGTSFPARLTGVALAAFCVIVITGWTLNLRVPNVRGYRPVRLLGIALLFPLIGTLIYLPWPSWNRFYALPFLLGGAILAALSLSAIEFWSRRAFIGAAAIWGLLLVFASADAYNQSSRLAARQLANRAVVDRLSELSVQYDTVFVATDQRVPSAWQGLGPTLERFGLAFGLDMPVVVNLPCQEGRDRTSEGRMALVAYASHCPGFAGQRPIVFRYRRLSLLEPRVVPDSLRVDFIIPTFGDARVP